MTTTTTSIVQKIASGAGGFLTQVHGVTYSLTTGEPHLLLFGPLGVPANATILSAQMSLAPSNTAPGADSVALLEWDGTDQLADEDLTAPLSGDPATGVAGTDTYYTLDFTSQVAVAVQSPGWHENASLKFLHTRSSAFARRYHTPYGDSDLPPKLDVTWEAASAPDPDPEPEPEQTYRIVGPAGLENVRLIGVTDEGGITTLRLTGEWNGDSVAPLD